MKRFAMALSLLAGVLFQPAVGSADENREFLFYLAPSGLVAIEFQITVEEKPFQAAWEADLDKRFQEIDKNQDGQIAGEERDKLPNSQLLFQIDSQQFVRVSSVPATLDRAAFGEHMQKLGFRPFQVNIQSAGNQDTRLRLGFSGMQNDPDQAAKLLFSKMDTDADGRLSRAEMEQAITALAKQDLDQDETISSSELVPVSMGQYFVSPSNPSPQTNQSPFLKLGDRATLRQAATQLTAKYDTREKDNALSRMELAMSEARFNKHDIDGNGKWDFEEIQQYLKSPTADVIVRIQLGTKSNSRQTSIEFQHGEELTSEVKNAIGSLNLGAAQMEFSVQARPWGNLEQTLKSQFKSVDQDNNGYVDKEESQRLSNASSFFQVLDLDRDGKLFAEEMLAGVLPVAELMAKQIQLTVTDRGKDLFRILDSDSDSRLSMREFWAMPDRAALWDKDQDGQIALSEVPQQYRLVTAFGKFELNDRFGRELSLSNESREVPSMSSSSTGPVWFQRMDRNADGDISPKEFLGTLKDFQKLDQNQDGLISPEEANRA